MNAILEGINSAGREFVGFAGPMLVQSSVLIVILLIGDFLLRRKVRAVLRYWLWMLVLVKLVLPISLATPVSLGQWFGGRLEYEQAEDTPAVVSEVAEPQPMEMEHEYRPVEAGQAEVSGEPLTAPPVTMVEPAVTAAVPEAVAITPVTWEGWLFLGWLAGVVAMGLLLVQRAIFVMGLVAQAKGVNGLMGDTLKYCCGRMGVKGEIGLKVSANATSPAVCGLFRPVILVPQDLGPNLGAGGLRVVLMHELAHIRRGDLWVNLVQTVLQIVYFYNPLLWAANAVIRRVREQAVDEAVQVAMGEKAGEYPETLVRVAKLAFERPALSLRLIGVVESKSTLQSRVRRMLERPLPKSAKLGFLGLAMILVVGAILLPMAKGMSGPPEFVIKGRVTAAETGLPIAGAKVGDVEKYADGQQWTTTDSDGNYGYLTWYEEHGIKAEAEGYKSEHKGLYTKLFGSEKEKVIDFALRQDGNRLEESKEKQFHVVWWMAGVEKEVYDQLAVIAQPVESQSKNYVGYSVDSEKLVGLISENRDVGNVIFTSKSKFLKPTSKYRIASSWADSGNLDHSVFVGYSTGGAGPYKLLQNGDNARLELEHETVSCLLNSGSSVQGAIFYDGDIKVDDSLVFAAKMPEKEASKPYHLVMYTGTMIEQEDSKIEDPIRYFHVKVVKKSSEYKATLTNGITVELVGVCEHPSFGKKWWMPNGDLLEEAPYDDEPFGRAFPRYGEKGYKFAVKLSGLAGKDLDYKIMPVDFQTTQGGGGSWPSEKNGQKNVKYKDGSLDEIIVWIGTSFLEEKVNCDIIAGVCFGEWKDKYKYETDKPNDAVEWIKFENVLLKPNFNPDVGLKEKEQIIKESESQARLLNHEYIGTEHILLALVAENSGIISDISKNFGITREAIYNETLQLVNKGKNIVFKKNLPMTPRAKLALKSANQLAKESNSVSVNSQHVLLGLLQVEDGVGAQVLMNLGLNLKKAQEAITNQSGQEASEQKTNSFAAILQNGVTVELVGVCEYPDPKRGWSAAGDEIRTVPWRLRDYDLETPENRQHYAFVAQISGSRAPSTHWHVQGGWETAYLRTVNDGSGDKLEGIEAFAAALPQDRKKTVVGIGVAAVPWETIATIKEKQGVSIGFCKGGEYTIQEPIEHLGGRTSDVKMVDTIDRSKYALRMVAMTNTGETITSAVNSTGGSYLTTTSHRYMLPLKQIKEFQLQTRPYEWVEFKDVSLKPKFKTDVQVEVENPALGVEGGSALRKGLVGYWDFDGNAADKAGNNNGTVYGAVLTEGVSGQAYYFEGDGDCINIPDSKVFDFNDGDFSVSLWFKTSYPINHFLINFRQNDNNPRFEIFVNKNVGTDVAPGHVRMEYPEAGARDDKWHHTVVTLENGVDDGYKLYLDGLEVCRGTYTGKLGDWDTITIGGRNKESKDSFKGTIDEVSVYSKAISTAEVKELYYRFSNGNNLGSSLKLLDVEKGLICYWDFEGDAVDNVRGIQGQTNGVLMVNEGVKGKCYYFEGDGDCISVPDSEIFDFGGGDFTISTWFRTNVNKAPFPFIVNLRQNDNNPHIEIYASWDVGSHLLPGFTRLTYPEAGINDDEWHHVAITLENGIENGYRLYIDGSRVSEATYTGRLEDWDTITIGAQRKGGNERHAFKGFIDEVSLYNRALSEDEIKDIYKSMRIIKETEREPAVGVEGGEVRVSGNAAVDIPTYSEIKEAIRSNYQARMELLENSSGAAEMFLEIRRSWLTKEGERRRGLKKAIWNTTWYVEGEKHRYDITIPAQEENNLYASQLVRPERVRAMVYPDRRVCYKVNENEVVIDKYLRTVGNPLGLSRFFEIRRLYKFNSRDYVLDSLTRWETKVEPEISEEMIGQIRCIKIMFDLEKANNWGRVEKWLLEFWLAPEQAYSLIKGQVLNNTGMEGTELKLLEGYEGRYRESKESDGVWLLEEVTITYNHIPNFGWERWKPGDGEKLKVKFVDKKVGVDIPEETFTLEALGIPDGTKVTDKLPGRLPREYIYYGGEIHEDSKSPSDPPGSEENSAVGIEGEKVPPPGRYALLFDGIDDYLEIDASESLQLGRHFTVQMWVKPEFPETSIPDKERNLLSKGGYVLGPPDEKSNRKTKPYGFGFKLIPEGESRVIFDVCNASHQGIYSREVILAKPSDWLHLAVVFDGEKGRINRGVFFELSEESYEPAPKSNIIIGGKFLIPWGNYFKGQIGELRIWNRALSFDEIAEFKTISLSGNEPNLVGCWTFEQTEGLHAIDISPYRNEAQLGSKFGVDNSDPTWVRIDSEKENAKNTDAEVEGGAEAQEMAVFESYFPYDAEAGRKLTEWWENKDSTYLDDDSFFELFRKGLRACTIEYRGNFPMQHIGGEYIGRREPDEPRAVDIVYHASFSPEFKYYAVYSGLSVANPKSEKVLRRLVDIAMEPHQLGRIIWGVKQSKQEDEFMALLEPYLQSSNLEESERADVVAKALRGEIDAGKWEREWNQRQKTDVQVEVEGDKYNLMARGGKGRVEVIDSNAANLIRQYLRALEKSDWKTALSVCSIDVKDKAQKYPAPESFFNTVVPVKEILNKLCDPRIGRWLLPPKYFAYIFDVRISQPNLPRDVSWVWKARRLEGRANWEIDFSAIPFETWLANEKQEIIRVAQEKEQLIKELAPRLKGVRTSLTAKKKGFVVGEPIYFNLRLINQSDSILSYDCQQVAVNNSMTIEGPDGKEVKYTAGPFQTTGGPVLIKPGETKTLFDQFDITKQYDIRQLGEYRVQFNGNGLSISIAKEGASDLNDPTSFEYYPSILPSNTVKLNVHQGIKQKALDDGEDGVEGEKVESQTKPAVEVEGEAVEGTDEIIQASELGAGAVSAEKGLQGLIDAARAGGTVIVPEGVYTEPISISKSLKLKGQSPTGSIFEVTANEPAIFVDTKGKGKVSIEGVTIKWQLATSDKNIEHPFAVAVKDTRAEVKRCNFVPLGNPKRSPVAIRAMGFSNLNIEACRFEGFEYVVCYGEGTEGVMSDSLIMDCGHQGVILYSGAKAKILRNVITGSRYHAVRSTGGTLDVRDNLLIENANRGIYLGNKSARGVIANNIIMGNGTGISGFARSRVRIQNNIIADSSYAGISMRDSCSLSIRNNILHGNAKGCILQKEGSKNANKVFRNLFWENEVDVENFDKPAVSISAEPGFVDPDNGDFSLNAGEALEHKQGLTDPNVFKILWKRWENRADENEPLNVPVTKTDSDVEAKEP